MNKLPENIQREEISFKTLRMQLRPVASSDLKFIHDLLSRPETDRYNALGIPDNIEATGTILQGMISQNIEGQQLTFLLMSKAENRALGMLGLNLSAEKYRTAEIWFKIHPDYWSRGYATESVKSMLQYAFEELNLHRVQAGCAVENMASIKVLEKAGMICEGRGRNILPLKNGWSDNFEYAILNTDFKASHL